MSSQNSLYTGYGTSPSAWEEYLSKTTFSEPKELKSVCNHEWKEIRLVISSVYDCKLCGCKKESVEK